MTRSGRFITSQEARMGRVLTDAERQQMFKTMDGAGARLGDAMDDLLKAVGKWGDAIRAGNKKDRPLP